MDGKDSKAGNLNLETSKETFYEREERERAGKSTAVRFKNLEFYLFLVSLLCHQEENNSNCQLLIFYKQTADKRD